MSKALTDAVNSLIATKHLSEAIYNKLVPEVEKLLKNIPAFKYKSNRRIEDVQDMVTNIILSIYEQVSIGNSFQNSNGYLYTIAKNELIRADISLHNKDYVLFREKLAIVLKNLENAGKICSNNDSYGTKDCSEFLSGDSKELIIAFRVFNSNEIRKGELTKWTAERMDALEENIYKVLASVKKLVALKDLADYSCTELGIAIPMRDTYDSDYEQSDEFLQIADNSPTATLSYEDIKNIELCINSAEDEIMQRFSPLSDKLKRIFMIILRHHKDLFGLMTLQELADLLGYKRTSNVDYYAREKFGYLQKMKEDFYDKAAHMASDSEAPELWLNAFDALLYEAVDNLFNRFYNKEVCND